MCLPWKIVRSLGCYVDNESILLKIIFISVLKARDLAPLQISAPLCEGLIYLPLLLSHHLLIKSTSWRAPLSFLWFAINWCWVWVWLDLFCHELQCLVSPWSSGVLCIYVLRPQKGIARYHFVILYHDCFEKVLPSKISYYCLLAGYIIDTSKMWDLNVIVNMVSS